MAEVTWRDQIAQRIERRLQLWRGRIVQFRGASVGIRFGLGRSVRVLYPSHFEAGHDVTIDDYGYLHCLSSSGVSLGNHTSIARNFWLSCGRSATSIGGFKIGDYSFIGPNSVMGAGGPISIGNHVQMGPNVTITAENHVFDDATLQIDQQGLSHIGVIIEDDCWIGGQATILDGVRIGRGSIVGAGAVVTTNIPPFSVAVGVPARVIKKRRQR
jgi:acetyltransferase-like isoleucine patch superfamily enzyme